jgi:hypothetical protein
VGSEMEAGAEPGGREMEAGAQAGRSGRELASGARRYWTFIHTLLICVSSSIDARPSVFPCPESLKPP